MSALRDDLELLDELRGSESAALSDDGRATVLRGANSDTRGGMLADGAEVQPLALSGPGTMLVDHSGGDWTQTLAMVERAAATIRAYEKRFVQLEKQTRALADRSAEDQHRLHVHIQALEERLKQAEDRVTASEGAARDAEYHEWEANMREKRAEQRATDAETKCRQLEVYLRRVHDLLATV